MASRRDSQHEYLGSATKHVASRAWMDFDAGFKRGVPTSVRVLKEREKPHHKSAVYLLREAGPNDTHVAAKHVLDTDSHEYDVLAALQDLGFRGSPRVYGQCHDTDGVWIFSEGVPGNPPDPTDAGHREAIARCLADLHTLPLSAAIFGHLPVRDNNYYQARLAEASACVRRASEGVSAAARTSLDRLAKTLTHLEPMFGALERAFSSLPRSLVHGDAAVKNLVFRSDRSTPEVVAVDWEMASTGFPGVDLLDVCVDSYFAGVSRLWSTDRESVEVAHTVARPLRYIDAIPWATRTLEFYESQRVLLHLDGYQRSLESFTECLETR